MIGQLVDMYGNPLTKEEASQAQVHIMMVRTGAREVNGRVMNMEAPYFISYQKPFGYLENERGAHACFYYAVRAQKMYTETVPGVTETRIQLEDEPWPKEKFEQLYRNTLHQYCVEHSAVCRHWHSVDMQFRKLQLRPLLPQRMRML